MMRNEEGRRVVRTIVGMVAAAALAAVLIALLCGCNYVLIDLQYAYERAMVAMPDGTVVSGRVDRWSDYGDSDMVAVTIDGVHYYTHGSNVVLYGVGEAEGAAEQTGRSGE